MKKALITGINGQDGSYLAEYLLECGYEVHGTKRRSSTITTNRIKHLLNVKEGVDYEGAIRLHHADLTDGSSVGRIISSIQPDEIYNLAAQSHVAVSFEEPEYTANTDALGLLRILEAVKREGYGARVYQASTSELFGGQSKVFYDESSVLDPRSPYAAAKAYAYHLVKMYRAAYGMFVVNGILFNHESPRRSENFVTRKITTGVARVVAGMQERIKLGNLDASRDWGHARDYCRAMHLMLQHSEPCDFVIATGKSITVREFVRLAFEVAGVRIEFENTGLEERGICRDVDSRIRSRSSKLLGKILVTVDSNFFRPLEVDQLVGNPAFAKKTLGWSPEISVEQLVEEMVRADCLLYGIKF